MEVSNGRLALALCLLLTGCSSAREQSFSAFFRRHHATEPEQLAPAASGSPGAATQSANTARQLTDTIEPVGHEEPAGGGDSAGEATGELAESIVARVNNEVILAEDVFRPIRPRLTEAKQKLPEADFLKLRSQLIQSQLRDLIDRQLLLQEAKRKIPAQGIQRLEAFADEEFGKQIEAGMAKMGVNTEAELRRKMLEEGDSLDQRREYFRGTFIVTQFLRMQLAPRLEVTRLEMLDYYNQHRDEFKKPGGVRWSEILVSNQRHGSRDAARAKAIELVKQLRAGADFAALAKKESDGATASQGGKWDLTTKGSYIVAAVDEAIFSLPADGMHDPIEGPEGWHIVRVDERVPDRTSSFVEVQDQIRAAIREEKIKQESQRFVQDLARRAHVTTIFDQPAQPQQR